MLAIPYKLNATEYSIFIVLQDDNLERIKQYDPAELVIAKMVGNYPNLKLKDVMIGYATDEDIQKVQELLASGESVVTMLKYLSRGFAYKPEQGDHDGPYHSLKNG